MPRVYLGNPSPIFNGRAVEDSNAVTMVSIPDCKSLDDMVRDIGHDDGSSNTGLWRQHSARDTPSWVACDENPELEAAIAGHFGCPAGRPGVGD
jgi:hypothetical protein